MLSNSDSMWVIFWRMLRIDKRIKMYIFVLVWKGDGLGWLWSSEVELVEIFWLRLMIILDYKYERNISLLMGKIINLFPTPWIRQIYPMRFSSPYVLCFSYSSQALKVHTSDYCPHCWMESELRSFLQYGQKSIQKICLSRSSPSIKYLQTYHPNHQ